MNGRYVNTEISASLMSYPVGEAPDAWLLEWPGRFSEMISSLARWQGVPSGPWEQDWNTQAAGHDRGSESVSFFPRRDPPIQHVSTLV